MSGAEVFKEENGDSTEVDLETNCQLYKNYNLVSLCVDWYTIQQSVGSFQDLNVVVLGSSDGAFCRAAEFSNAKDVVGVDIDSRKVSKANSLKIHKHHSFAVVDIRLIHSAIALGDVVINNFIFNYYYLRTDLQDVAYSTFANLKRGKRCYILLRNVLSNTFWGDSLQKYGITFEDREEIEGGYKMKVKKVKDKQIYESTQYCLKPAIYEEVLREVGFVNLRLLPLRRNPIGFGEPDTFWITFFENPHLLIISADRP